MPTVTELRRKLKDPPGDLKMVVMIDGQYYDIDLNNIRSVWVKSEKDWTDRDCYGIADKETPDSFQVYAIE
jgi:hypothetical protein